MSYISREPIPKPSDQTGSEGGTLYLLSCLITAGLVAALLVLTALSAPIGSDMPDDLMISGP